MTFEEDYPSLKGKVEYSAYEDQVCEDLIDEGITDEQTHLATKDACGRVEVPDIQEHCLDKERVIKRIIKLWEDSSSFEDFKKEVFYWLEGL